jgi:hypothetical protein
MSLMHGDMEAVWGFGWVFGRGVGLGPLALGSSSAPPLSISKPQLGDFTSVSSALQLFYFYM